eukprot:11221154-Karenia_brevis.AAC.1
MTSVNYGFTNKGSDIEPYKNFAEDWKTLAEVLQQDAETRRRILYYHAVAVTWMSSTSVDALAAAQPGIARFPLRNCRCQSGTEEYISAHPANGEICGYEKTGSRERCPQKPNDLPWSAE